MAKETPHTTPLPPPLPDEEDWQASLSDWQIWASAIALVGLVFILGVVIGALWL